MEITRRSMLTGKTHTRVVNATQQEIAAWQAGALIQDAMPFLSVDDREFIMSGITPEEWDALSAAVFVLGAIPLFVGLLIAFVVVGAG